MHFRFSISCTSLLNHWYSNGTKIFSCLLIFLIIKNKASQIDIDTESNRATDSHRNRERREGKACSKICVSKHIKSLSKKINGKGGVGKRAQRVKSFKI